MTTFDWTMVIVCWLLVPACWIAKYWIDYRRAKRWGENTERATRLNLSFPFSPTGPLKPQEKEK